MSDRHAFRAEWHDYNSGIYFVTICSKDKQHIFGKIKDSIMILSDIGKIVERCILDISNHHTNVELWNHVIMPNHIHMVINVGTQPAPVGTRYIASAKYQELGVKLFQNDDNTFDVCAYHYMQGDWMPLGDAEEENHFATESEALEHGISIIKNQTDYWDWALSEECTNERIKTTVCQNLDISPGMKPILHLY